MPPHRININEFGHAHELTFSCYHRFPFMKAEQTCQWLAGSINRSRERFGFQLWAYVFMPDHVHLLLYLPSASLDIANVRKSIKAPVAKQAIRHLKEKAPEWLPRIRRQRGGKVEHLFWQSGGGYDRNVTEPSTLQKMIDYIHLNPVRKGLVERAREWKWSSAAWFEDLSPLPLVVDPIPKEWLE